MKTFAISFLCSPSKIRKKTGEAPIEVSISVNGDRVYYQTPKTCDPRVFKKLLRSNSLNDIKVYTDTVRQRINEIQTSLYVRKINVTAKRVKAELEGQGADNSPSLKSVANEYLSTKTGIPTAYYKYRNTFRRAQEEWGAEKPVDEITPNDIIKYKEKYSTIFKQSTLRNDIKRIKSLLTFALNAGYIKNNPFSTLKFSFREDDKPYLTYDEIEAIRDAKLDERYDSVRNFFLFLCFSGLEYSDAVHLKKDDVKINRYGQYYIKKKRVKTGVEYISILYEDAAELWELFGGDIKIISNQKTNASLKIIAEAAGIDKTITTLTARHTYATYLLSVRCLPIDIVQRMLGHTSPRQSLHYAKMMDDTVFSANRGNRYPARHPQESQTRQDAEDIRYFRTMFGLDEEGT